jgi:hypothetical protein
MTLSKSLLAAAIGAAALALSGVSASAAMACAGNVCWHSHDRYHYPRAAHVVVHEDNWHAGPGITIREHEGRGYWRGDRWTAW